MVKQNITIALDHNIDWPKVSVVQGDSGRVLVCKIWKFPNLKDYTVNLYAKKPSGKVSYLVGETTDSTVEINLTTQILAEVGELRCQLQVVGADTIVTSFGFIIEVFENTVKESALESTNEFTALEKALLKVNNLNTLSGDNESNGNNESRLTIEDDGNYAKKRDVAVNILDFGAVDDGKTDTSQALKNAIASIPNGGTIQFPRTSKGFAFSKPVRIPRYVSLQGDKTLIIRLHDYKVDHHIFDFMGNNTFENFIYEGGGPDTVNYIQYTDFRFHGEGSLMQNNYIENSRGTCIGGYGNCTITNNFFGEFGDHLVYMGGSADVTSGNYIFTNNHIQAPVVRRDVMKFRNAGENTVVSNNIFNVPNAVVFNYTNGDDFKEQGVMKNLMFTNNNIVASRYLGYIGQTVSGNSSGNGRIVNILIAGNNINTKDYMIIGDSLFKAGNTQSYFNGTTVTFESNTFEQTPVFHMSSVGDLHVIFNNNTFKNLNPGANCLFAVRNNVDLDFTNNTIIQSNDGAWSLVTLPNRYAAIKVDYVPSKDITWNICGNVLHGIRILLNEKVDGTPYFNEYTLTTIKDNVLYKEGLSSSLGTTIGKGAILLYNNIYYYAGAISTLYVSRSNTVELGYDNMSVLSGKGNPNGKVAPRFVGDRYLDTKNKITYTGFKKLDDTSWA